MSGGRWPAIGIPRSGGWPAIQDNFSGTLANWTQTSANAMVISSGALTGPYSDANAGVIHKASAGGAAQAVEFKLVNRGSEQGVLLWAASSANNSNLILLKGFDNSGGQYYAVYTCIGGLAGTRTQVGGDPQYTSVVGNYYGVKISGPANSASIAVYNNGTASGGAPSTWSAGNIVVSFSGLNLSAVTPGNYVGYRISEAPGAIDDFKAGTY